MHLQTSIGSAFPSKTSKVWVSTVQEQDIFCANLHWRACSKEAVALTLVDQSLVQAPRDAREASIDLRNEVALQRCKVQPSIFVADVKAKLCEAEVPPMHLSPAKHHIARRHLIFVDLHMPRIASITQPRSPASGMPQKSLVLRHVLRIPLHERSCVKHLPAESAASFQWKFHCDCHLHQRQLHALPSWEAKAKKKELA